MKIRVSSFKEKTYLKSNSVCVCVCVCVYVCVCVRVFAWALIPTLFAISAFGPQITADRGESVTHFLFLHHFCEQIMYICK